jgi:hypothetical protein
LIALAGLTLVAAVLLRLGRQHAPVAAPLTPAHDVAS